MTPGATLTLAAQAQPLFLVSPWKPLLVLLPMLGWAWLASTVLDKDAARFYFKRRQWNIGHAAAGILALLAGLLSPMIWIGLPVMLAIIAADVLIYMTLRNKDSRVPEASRWSLNPATWVGGKGDAKGGAAAKKAKDKKAATVTLAIKGPKGAIEAPEKETPEYAIRAAAESVVVSSIDARATRFDLAPMDVARYGFSWVTDGVRQQGDPIPTQEAVAVIDFWKRAAGMDAEDRRRKQQADITIERFNVKIKLRLATQGAGGGMQLTGTFDPEKQVARKIEELGLLPQQREELDAIINDPEGVALVAAPGDNGRTTALFAILRAHDAYTTNVQTLELEQEGTIEGVRHNLFDPSVDGAEFATTARSILRRDPDVLAIAEMPDPLTAQEAAKADVSRTRVYLGMRIDGAMPALQTYVKAVGEPDKAAKGLHGVVACKLLRRLCPNCKAAYQPTPDMLKKLGLPGDKPLTLYRKGGQVLVKNKPETCPMCGGGGYLGQEGCFEVHTIDAEGRGMIAKGDYAGLKAAFRKKRQPSIQECAVRKAAEGVTSVEEVVRITTPPAAAAGASAPRPAGGAPPSGAKPAPPGAAPRPASAPAKPPAQKN